MDPFRYSWAYPAVLASDLTISYTQEEFATPFEVPVTFIDMDIYATRWGYSPSNVVFNEQHHILQPCF